MQTMFTRNRIVRRKFIERFSQRTVVEIYLKRGRIKILLNK